MIDLSINWLIDYRAYDPADYEHLAVTPEIKEMFQYITM